MCLLPIAALSLHDFWLLSSIVNVRKESKPRDRVSERDSVFQMSFARFPGVWGQALDFELCVLGVWLSWEEEDGVLLAGNGHRTLRGSEKALNRQEWVCKWESFCFPFRASSLVNFYFYTHPENMERIICVLANLFPTGPDQRRQKQGDNWFLKVTPALIFWADHRSHFQHTYVLAMCCPLEDVLIEYPWLCSR